MNASQLQKRFLQPLVIALGLLALLIMVLISFGELLLANVDHSIDTHSIRRPELWVAIIPAIVLLVAAWMLAHRPPGSVPVLEKEVMIGNRPFFEPEPPTVDVMARSGELGTTDDIIEGYTLYAQSGPLARVIGLVPGSLENGRQFRGYMYASGLHGASPQLWIPYEAVYAVYPQTKSAFLAIKGDETEAYGWDKIPESMSRAPRRRHVSPPN